MGRSRDIYRTQRDILLRMDSIGAVHLIGSILKRELLDLILILESCLNVELLMIRSGQLRFSGTCILHAWCNTLAIEGFNLPLASSFSGAPKYYKYSTMPNKSVLVSSRCAFVFIQFTIHYQIYINAHSYGKTLSVLSFTH